MNMNAAFLRKVIYIAAIALLLIPLYLLGSPSRRDEGGIVGGGYLAKQRTKHRLAQVSLGEIDPAGEAMRLACLGMRGVAANILWTKANYYKKTEQFDNMATTVNQITKLQPNFIKVWEFQAHNLSFNTSVEYDDFRFRYHWVVRGLEFLMQGIRYNREEPRLLWSLGWFTEQKIGRSDEYRQFRPLFRDDGDYHAQLKDYINLDGPDGALGPDGKPDNWLVAQKWMLKAQDLVDNKGASLGGKSPLVFHSSPSMSLMYYAMAIEEDGYLDEVGRRAWERAGKSWHRYGAREIPTSYGFDIRLNNREYLDEQVVELVAKLDGLAPAVREELRQQKYQEDLSDEERAAWDVPEEQRNAEQSGLARQAEQKLEVPHDEVADEAPANNRKQARRLARLIADKQWTSTVVARYRDIVNFDYWRTRCEAEQTAVAIEARKNVYRADQEFDNINLVKAKQLYETAWENWAKIFDRHPSLLEDVSAEDVVDSIKRYRRCLDQLGEPFPDPFILQPLLDLHEKTMPGAVPPPAGDQAEPADSGADGAEPDDAERSGQENGADDASGDVDPAPSAAEDAADPGRVSEAE